MRFTRTSTIGLALSLALLSGTAACSKNKTTSGTAASTASSAAPAGIWKLPSKDIAAKAMAYLQKAEALRIKGSMMQDGAPLDMDYSFIGSDSSGTISMKDTGKMQLMSVGGSVYFKFNDEYMRKLAGGDAGAMTMLGGKWLKAAPTDKDFSQITGLTQRSSFVSQMVTGMTSGAPNIGATKTVNGVECVALEDTDKAAAMYVAKDNARPIEIVSTAKDSAGTLDFTYDGITAPKAPPASEVFDMAQLAHK